MQKEEIMHAYEKLEAGRISLAQRLLSADEKSLHLKPAAGKWSIAQIIFHMISSEQGAINYISKKSQGGTSVPRAGIDAALKSFMLTLAIRFTKFKKPPVLPDPPEQPEVGMLMQQWEETRKKMKELIQKLPEDMFSRAVMRHPYGGRLNMKQTFSFFQEHVDHHLKQINRLLNKTDLISS